MLYEKAITRSTSNLNYISNLALGVRGNGCEHGVLGMGYSLEMLHWEGCGCLAGDETPRAWCLYNYNIQ